MFCLEADDAKEKASNSCTFSRARSGSYAVNVLGYGAGRQVFLWMVRTMQPESGGAENESDKEMDTRTTNKKRKKKSDSNHSESDDGSFLVGMVAVTVEDGIFKDPHVVGKFVGEKLGRVKSIRVTRSGMVIIECVSEKQREQALKIEVFVKHLCVRCFRLDEEPKSKGVVTGVPVDFDVEEFLDVSGVCGVRRLSRFIGGESVESTSVCLTFEGTLPDKVLLDYVCYKVRPFTRGPLRCFCCQEYGHVAAVCKGRRKCGRCGGTECEFEECVSDPKCVHCSGTHRTGARECPRRKMETEVNRIRAEKQVSYADAVKVVKGQEQVTTKRTEAERAQSDPGLFCLKKRRFLAFIAVVVNCSEKRDQAERIDLILDAAKRYLEVGDLTKEDLAHTLEEG
ncbi:hypothetical protein WMY93_032176 [Mugilogobius chulae]|uniref:Gag-like protein n=1 Tax=Mugilogobius chulae TaxID=88201 RepID=A0AAW0MFZ5_9GOBI